jgi:hypothetical protein
VPPGLALAENQFHIVWEWGERQRFSPFSFFGPVKVNLVEIRAIAEVELDLAIRIVAVRRRAYNPRDKEEVSPSTEEASQMNHEC